MEEMRVRFSYKGKDDGVEFERVLSIGSDIIKNFEFLNNEYSHYGVRVFVKLDNPKLILPAIEFDGIPKKETDRQLFNLLGYRGKFDFPIGEYKNIKIYKNKIIMDLESYGFARYINWDINECVILINTPKDVPADVVKIVWKKFNGFVQSVSSSFLFGHFLESPSYLCWTPPMISETVERVNRHPNSFDDEDRILLNEFYDALKSYEFC